MEIEEKLKSKLLKILKEISDDVSLSDIEISKSDSRIHGDFTTNICLKCSKRFHKSPIEIGEYISKEFKDDEVNKVEVVKPGFLNFYLGMNYWSKIIKNILSLGSNYGCLKVGEGLKVNIEYVSANPTGYLHVGHARGAAIGDCLSRIYTKAGYDVTREYYINDAGSQMDHLAVSIMVRYENLFTNKLKMPEDGYYGPEIIKVAEDIKNKFGDKYLKNCESHLQFFKEYGGNYLLDQIKEDLKNFRVLQDVYTSELSIRNKGMIEKVLKKIEPFTYKKDGAIYLNTTKDGDDKDRVIVKSDGSYTYLLPDIAYHDDKFNRGFDLLIDLFGADHHGYIDRLKSSQKDLGHDPDKLKISLVQIVRLIKDGEEVKMSKRTGNAISLRELVEEVGVDSCRYFFVSRAKDSHLDFDLDLAKKIGVENPVFYAQYTHARLCSILNNGEKDYKIDSNIDLLTSCVERDLLILLKEYPSSILEAVKEIEPYKITFYIDKICKSINEFYSKCKVLDKENPKLTSQRLALVKALQIVLSDALNLIGVSALTHMESK